jgi:DNA-binding XRE family transcriptional regulator
MSDYAAGKKTLRELREERGMTREQLAVALNVPFTTLVNIETGRNRPRVELAERIYAFFGVPLGSIQWGRRDESPKRTPVAA